jgi:antitoxin ParD1/3/4
MTRQSISLTAPNEEWLRNRVNSEEFSTKSEAVNYLIKQARSQEEYFDFIRNKINKSEESGHSSKTKKELLAKIKKGLNV